MTDNSNASTPPKRFLVFGGLYNSPYCGWEHLRGSFDTVKEARAYLREQRRAWVWSEIVDLQTGETEMEAS